MHKTSQWKDAGDVTNKTSQWKDAGDVTNNSDFIYFRMKVHLCCSNIHERFLSENNFEIIVFFYSEILKIHLMH